MATNMKRLQHALFLFLLSITFTTSADEDAWQLIISLNSNVSEILLAFGLEDQVVASDVTSQTLFNSDRVQNVGYHRTLSTEGILSTHANILIGSSHMGPDSTIDTLKKANLSIIKLDDPQSSDGLVEQIHNMGELLNQHDKAHDLIDDVEQQIERINTLTTHNEKTMIFLLDMGQSGVSMAGQQTTGLALIELLKGQSKVDYQGYKPISSEAILAINPDVILVGQRGGTTLSPSQLLDLHPMLAHTEAGKTGHIVNIDASKMIAGISLGLLNEAERVASELAR